MAEKEDREREKPAHHVRGYEIERHDVERHDRGLGEHEGRVHEHMRDIDADRHPRDVRRHR